ncbi:MAG: magnesium/cobalt transporter CorA [Flavobacteriales bacterium]
MATKRSEKSGLPPGSLVPVTSRAQGSTAMNVFTYSEAGCSESSCTDVKDLVPCTSDTVTWIDVDGLKDLDRITALGERFDLHALLIEDILNTDHRPKVEEYKDHLFVVAKMLTLHGTSAEFETEQVSFVLGRNYVLSIQERPGDILDPVRERIRNGTGRVRRKGPDYLLYSLLDVLVDNYFSIVDTIGDRVSDLEKKVIVRPQASDLLALQRMRSLLITVNRYVLPTRELAGRLSTMQNPLIDKNTRRYLNDLQDHTVYIAESIGMFRDMLSNLENTYHAQQNARLSQVMKLLTVISTIFIPLTFVVGVYGMNFDHMPELHWPHGYFIVMCAMAGIAGVMLIWFKRRGWL